MKKIRLLLPEEKAVKLYQLLQENPPLAHASGIVGFRVEQSFTADQMSQGDEAQEGEDLNASANLESDLIKAFLASKNLTVEDLTKLPPAERNQIMVEAVKYATLRLTEIETKLLFQKNQPKLFPGITDNL
jgi:hypothetical protein